MHPGVQIDMDIKNEEHLRDVLEKWQELPLLARKREIRLAIDKLELSSMYYEQTGNDKGVQRANNCVDILTDHLDSIE